MMSIAKATLREATKKKILILIGIITVLYLAMLTFVLYFVGKEARPSGMDQANSMSYLMEISVQVTSIVGFYFSAMLVAFMTILLSTGALSAEIESGVLQGVIAKPITRQAYYLGKYLGYTGIVVVFSTILYSCVLLLSALFGMPFMEMTTVQSVLGGWALFVLEPLSILGVSLWLGISLKSIAGAILMGGLFVFSMIGSFLGQIGSITESVILTNIGTASVFIAPFDALYKRMSAVFFAPTDTIDVLTMLGDATGTTQGPWIFWYSLFYIAVTLLIGIWRFRRKDL